MNDRITDPLDTMPVFVNQLASSGALNGVVNLSFATALFTPGEDNQVDANLIITCQLRMDLYCAQQVHQRLGQILEANTKPARTTEH